MKLKKYQNRLSALLIVLLLFSQSLIVDAQKELKFSSLESLYAFAEQNSSVIKNNEQQVLLAKYQKIAAITNLFNFTNKVALSLNDNNQLPVSFVPAQLLGGTPGTFKELTMGQKYVSNLSFNPQIDIINPASYSKLKSANISEKLTNTTNLINKESLFESIAACYYNISSFQEQIELTNQNLLATDTLLTIVKDKYALGLVRQQDVNDATVNKLSLQDKLNQLQASLEQQYNSLKILCDIPQNDKLIIIEKLNYNQKFTTDLKVMADLHYKTSLLENQSAKADLQFNKLSNLPVLSVFYNYTYYQNSNKQFFDENINSSKWLNSGYLGLKLSFSLPDVNKIVQVYNSKINYNISLIKLEHSKTQNDLNNQQIQLDYQKAFSQYLTTQQIATLKEQNYRMAFNQYEQSILPFDKLLTAFSDMLLSRLNYSSALASLLYTKSKIDLNNNIK